MGDDNSAEKSVLGGGYHLPEPSRQAPGAWEASAGEAANLDCLPEDGCRASAAEAFLHSKKSFPSITSGGKSLPSSLPPHSQPLDSSEGAAAGSFRCLGGGGEKASRLLAPTPSPDAPVIGRVEEATVMNGHNRPRKL